jgi:two-component system sensor histidine kinase BarA
VLTDPVRLRQIISNLVNNAVKFTETGGVLVKIEPVPSGIRVSVQDTGVGIPKDKLASLFEAFTQVDQSTTRKYGGTGLGLAICKKLVDSMGGELSVRSALGKGSVFSFVAPFETAGPAHPWPKLDVPGERVLGDGFGSPASP